MQMMVAHYAGQVPLVSFRLLHFVSKNSISYYISNDGVRQNQERK